jgi:hypothetical protein
MNEATRERGEGIGEVERLGLQQLQAHGAAEQGVESQDGTPDRDSQTTRGGGSTT